MLSCKRFLKGVGSSFMDVVDEERLRFSQIPVGAWVFGIGWIAVLVTGMWMV